MNENGIRTASGKKPIVEIHAQDLSLFFALGSTISDVNVIRELKKNTARLLEALGCF